MDGWQPETNFENMIENICEIKIRGQESIDLIWRVGTRQLGFWKLSPGRMRRKGFTVLRLPNHGPHTFNVAHKSFLHLYLIITTRNGRLRYAITAKQKENPCFVSMIFKLKYEVFSLCSWIVWRHLNFYTRNKMESCMQLCWPHCFTIVWKRQLSLRAHEWIVRCRIGARPQIYPL